LLYTRYKEENQVNNEHHEGKLTARHNVVCPFCGKDTLPDSHYCIFCGGDLSDQTNLTSADSFVDPDATLRFCCSCGSDIPGYAVFCNKCGSPQRSANKPAPFIEVDDRIDNLINGYKSIVTCYVLHHNMRPGSLISQTLFPQRWFSGISRFHIKAVAEAIYRDILIEETETWQKEMAENHMKNERTDTNDREIL